MAHFQESLLARPCFGCSCCSRIQIVLSTELDSEAHLLIGAPRVPDLGGLPKRTFLKLTLHQGHSPYYNHIMEGSQNLCALDLVLCISDSGLIRFGNLVLCEKPLAVFGRSWLLIRDRHHLFPNHCLDQRHYGKKIHRFALYPHS